MAGELAAKAGLVLDPSQQESLDVWCAVGGTGRWLCFECVEMLSRQNGKGSILEARVLAGFLLFGEEMIVWTAHQYKTALELFLRLKRLIKRLIEVGEIEPSTVKEINSHGEQGFERLDTGQRIKFIARSKDSGRGFSGDLVIIDEAYAYTDQMQEALMPTMSARPNPQIIYASSPPLTGDTGEILYALRERGEAGADPALCWRDWGVAGDLDNLDKVDLDDRALWHAANPALGRRISEEHVARERRALGNVGFARERLGIWPVEVKAGNGVIDMDLWGALTDVKSKRAGDIAIAVDITPERDRAAISMRGTREDGLAHWELMDIRPGTEWVVDRLVGMKARHNPAVIAIDGKGPAASLIPALAKRGIKVSEDKDQPQRGDLLITGPQDMADAFGMFVDAAKQKTGRHRDQPDLTSALAGAKTRTLGDGGQAWGRKGSTNIAPLVAVTLAHYAYETRAHLVAEDGPPNLW
ncbi:terminase large subunit domain-containing protein [Virgisporangium aliadipatigenens]|nr:terminase large subunit [Virgisporangium aliadipatigenens]